MIQQSLDDDKADDITFIELPDNNSIADYMVIATGNSNRHVNAICDHLLEKFKKEDIIPLSVDGLENCDWVLIDIGHIIIHLFKPEIRQFYDLEKLWQSQT